MRRLVGFVLMAALVAPALAVCAGGMRPAAAPTSHDCCPKGEATLTPTPIGSSTSATCCRMSAEAARRSAIQSIDFVPPSEPLTRVGGWLALNLDRSSIAPAIDSGDPPHIARHLLLSVLIV